jgi:hypothetical protein
VSHCVGPSLDAAYALAPCTLTLVPCRQTGDTGSCLAYSPFRLPPRLCFMGITLLLKPQSQSGSSWSLKPLGLAGAISPGSFEKRQHKILSGLPYDLTRRDSREEREKGWDKLCSLEKPKQVGRSKGLQ